MRIFYTYAYYLSATVPLRHEDHIFGGCTNCSLGSKFVAMPDAEVAVAAARLKRKHFSVVDCVESELKSSMSDDGAGS